MPECVGVRVCFLICEHIWICVYAFVCACALMDYVSSDEGRMTVCFGLDGCGSALAHP